MLATAPRPIEVVQVHEMAVQCDGTGPGLGIGRLGHPRVYLRMQGPLGTIGQQVTCPYCSRLFVLSGEPTGGDGH